MKNKLHDLPFFNDALIEIYSRANEVGDIIHQAISPLKTPEEQCRLAVHILQEHDLLQYSVAPVTTEAANPVTAGLTVRALCLVRQALAEHHALADFSFAMQGLGSIPIALYGSPAQKEKYLPATRSGQKIAAFALSEAESGSDAAALGCLAKRTKDGFVLNGEKMWISNGNIADYYCVFARTDSDKGAKGISAFIVDATSNGIDRSQTIDVMSPHPLSFVKFKNTFVPEDHCLGSLGEGFKIAMSTLDVFRCSVAGAALGFATTALDTAIEHAKSRAMFGRHLIDFQMSQATIGELALKLDAALLLTYRAAWLMDVKHKKTTLETAMAKYSATENAQEIIDRSLQMLGGRGLISNSVLERLYRDIRALRIYEGASEVQKLIIARQVIRAVQE